MDGLHLEDLLHVRDEGVAYTTLRARMHGFEFERFAVLPAHSMQTGRGLLRYIASLQLYADEQRALRQWGAKSCLCRTYHLSVCCG